MFPQRKISKERERQLLEELMKPYTKNEQQKQGTVIAPSFIKNPEDYIGIPQFNTVISKRESLHNYDFDNTIDEIKKLNPRFFMPPIPYFMTHFFNVREAVKGSLTLNNGLGSPLTQEEANKLWQYFTSKNRDQFGTMDKDKLCWTWLNAKFIKGTGFNNLDIETFNAPTSQKQPLEQCLLQNTYVSLNLNDFNSQKMPKPTIQTHSQYTEGENIHFYHPVENRVARFSAGSGGAVLFCYGGPGGSNPALGVFFCAEGTARP